MVHERPDQQAIDVFLDATELAPEDRDAFVGQACGDDDGLRSRVWQLLAAHDAADAALGPTRVAPAHADVADRLEDELVPGSWIGAYELVSRIAEGGFGTVWRARQHEPLERDVALKVIKPGMDSKEVVGRFEVERQALALMSHPNIAQVHDAGATERGRPFFVMEFVDGDPITTFCERHQVSLTERLQLFRSVCLAVQHAHQKGIVHRDLKPGNVLVSRVDGTPTPKVIDFGIAKAIGVEPSVNAMQTMGGLLVGTPAYMSPEQAEGAQDIDTRTDVYSLGVLLYELLCGTSPFGVETVGAVGLPEVLRRIREQDPPRPSTRIGVSGVATRAPVSSRAVRGDLDWIVMRCLEKEREQRYGSVTSLANEIQRFLRGEPVEAGPPTVSYRLRKLARRHRTVVAATVIVFVALLTTTLFSISQARRAERARLESVRQTERAELELERQRATANFLEHLLASIDPAVARDTDTTLLKKILQLASNRIDQLTTGPPEVEATLRFIIGGAHLSLGDFRRAETEFDAALAIQARELGPDDPLTLRTVHSLGGVMLQTGRFDEAEELLTRCWEGRSALLGPDHADTVHALGELVLARREQGDLAEAEPLQRELLDANRRLHGDRHEETLRTMNNLANTLERLGRLDEAEAMFQETLELQIESGQRDHPDTLKTITNLASVYESQGRTAQCVPLLEMALETKRRVLPAGHPSLIVGLNNLAHVYAEVERREDADRLFDEARDLAETHLGATHRMTIGLRVNEGRRLLARGAAGDAITVLGAAVTSCREHLRRLDPLTVSGTAFLTEALIAEDRYDEAVAASATLVADGEGAFPPDNPAHAVYRVLRGLALARAAARDDPAAVEFLETGLARLAGSQLEAWQDRARAAIAEIQARATHK